jgi:4-aminobutyrate aminotransferase-like enzyme
MDSRELLERRERALGAGAELFYRHPIQLVRGQGAYVFDETGRRYIDFYNNVPAVGHGNAHVADAISNQQRTLNINSRYLHEGVVAYAERLESLHCSRIESFVFSCSGTEANDVAIQMARLATGKRGILCTNAAYHGNSDLVGRLTNVGRTQPESPDIHAFPFPDLYRPIAESLSQQELEDAYLAQIQEAIERFAASGVGLAAMLTCSIFANEGLPNLPNNFMTRAAEMVRAADGLVIADEVQAGFGRTGHWWGYEATGFEPDIVTLGKPMGNGVPISATGASRNLIERFRGRTDHFNTYASSPLQAAAGMAVLEVIEREALLDNARQVGAMLKEGLEKIAAKDSHLGDVRGRGLFIVVDVVTDRKSRTPDSQRATVLADRLKELGFLTAAAGAYKNLLKVRPPLVVSKGDAASFLEAFETARQDICG